MSNFEAKRVHCTHEERIQALVDQVFPLACPIEEYKWIDGWQCNITYSRSGRIEDDCIFTEDMIAPFLLGSDVGPTTWITTLYDPEGYCVHFVLITSATVAEYEIDMEDLGSGATSVKWDFTLTSLNGKGSKLIDENTQDKMLAMLTFAAQSLKHYCETGEMLKMGRGR
jgi:hypothetical protein